MRFNMLILLAVCTALIGGCKSGDPAASTPSTEATTSKTPADTSSKSDASANSLTGTWTADAGDNAGGTSEYTFEEGGTYVMVIDGTVPGKGVKIHNETKGTYKVDGDKLSMKMTSSESTSTDATMQAELTKAKEATDKAISQMPEVTGTLQW